MSDPEPSPSKPVAPARRLQFALRHTSARKLVALGYLSYMLLGWALLSLPGVTQVPTAAIDDLFVAASAVSTTGLSPLELGSDYSLFGQLVVLILIQLGGLGYMSFGSYVVLTRSRSLSPWRAAVADEALPHPKDFDTAAFLRAAVVFGLAVEALGAVALSALFARSGVENPIWQGVFHSISAFCTAGFSLFEGGLERFADDPGVLLVVLGLSYIGAIGFIVLLDLWQNTFGGRRHLSFTSKVILQVTLWLGVGGTLLVALTDAQLAALPPAERLLAALFQVGSAATTVGFASLPMSALAASSLLVIMVLMVIGASPSGTGGGLKVTSLSSLVAIVRSTVKGRDGVRLWKRPISPAQQHTTISALCYWLAAFALALFLLLALGVDDIPSAAFEVASALGTVGLSLGLTGELDPLGKLVIIVLMYMGRIGILSFGILTTWHDESREEELDADLVV